MTRPSPGNLLRDSAAKGTVQVPGAFNALAGRLIERAGFKAAYLSGGAFSAGALAVPDIGLFTLTELAEQTKRLARSVSIPVMVDADTGFGGAMQVERTIEELERAIGKKAILDRKPAQPGDVERTFADLTRARAELGYEPKIVLRDGLKRFVDWFNEFGHLYKLPGE